MAIEPDTCADDHRQCKEGYSSLMSGIASLILSWVIAVMVHLSTRKPQGRRRLKPPVKKDVFISYSRKDKTFVEKLEATFHKVNRHPWIDWEDIHKGEDWWQSILRGIAAADTFIFVISPDSVASEVCRKEIDYAAQCHKRCLPLVWREGFDMQDVHPWIAQHNWLFLRETDDLDAAHLDLFKALDTDLEHVRAHTRLLLRSLEWFHQGRDRSYLLRGTDLQTARKYLSQAHNLKPRPTEGQIAYVNASLKAEAHVRNARQRAKWVIVLTTVLANLALVTGGLFWIHGRMTRIAQAKVAQAMEETLDGALRGINGDEFAELITTDLAPGQQEPLDNALYQRHQTWLKTIHQVTPSALPTTYARGDTPREVVIIGDIYRAINPAYAYPFRQPYPLNQAAALKLLDGFDSVGLNLEIYTDPTGKPWVAIYGPIQNSAGESVGALILEYDAAYLSDLKGSVTQEMALIFGWAAIWLVISSRLILRAIQPSRERLEIQKRVCKQA